MLALVLAGGEGGRLGALTEERAKPALPFAGVYRLIDFPLSNCHHSRISDVWVLQQYEPHSLADHLSNGRPWDLDRTFGGLRVVHPSTGDPESGFYRGNADAIYRSREAIAEFDPEVVLVLSADAVYKLDYRQVVERHRDSAAEATIVTTRVAREEASRFGIVVVGENDRVVEFAYKPEEPATDVVASEVFVYDARVLLDTLDELADGEDGLEDFGHELLPRLVERGKAYAYELGGYWRDVGTVESYWESHMDLLGREPRFDLSDRAWPILTRASQRPPAWIESSAEVEDSLVSPGAVVGGRVVRSVLGPGVVVEAGANVVDCVVLNDVTVLAGAVIERAVVDAHLAVGEHARGRDEIELVAGECAAEPGRSSPRRGI